jgi:hypothetical protein
MLSRQVGEELTYAAAGVDIERQTEALGGPHCLYNEMAILRW